ncbi:NnrU family protein [Paracoccus sp. S3-43]|uniref:NnrU family protein n=1 Tax=Paracoccus sp. S3-43 TaxID=3030011 RepID=UPI0023B06E05|nr:NnrU family protein [Paracoccus sp. S3-43]WEF23956.1 NnrU family protein [Paracoccus sp. S3-43]
MSGWGEYLAAWACFLGAHLIPALPGPRGWLVARLGRRGYLVAFSLLSIGLLSWLILAAGRAPHVHLWDQPLWSRWLVNIAMPLAILVAVLAVGLSGLIVAFTLWAGAHLVANGDLAHAILFGGMLVFALSGVARSGLPGVFRVTWQRLVLAVLIWAALLHLHPLLIGVSPLPA